MQKFQQRFIFMRLDQCKMYSNSQNPKIFVILSDDYEAILVTVYEVKIWYPLQLSNILNQVSVIFEMKALNRYRIDTEYVSSLEYAKARH